MRHLGCGNMIKYLILMIGFLPVCTTTGICQLLKFEEATKLSSSINSDSEESMPLISNDGKTMYFVRSFYKENTGGKYAGQDIWKSKNENFVWGEATNQLGTFNNKKNNAVVGIRKDGKTLYLLDSYGGRVHGIAFTRYINGKWSKPENIPITGLSREGFTGFYMNPSYDVLLISMYGKGSYGKEDLYVCLKDKSNKWSEPTNLGATINSSGFEISPFLSKDKKYLFFASSGHPGFGNADIFVSERLYNSWDIWSVPKNLGPAINSRNFDAYFTLTTDSTVYFSSNRGSEYASIYSSSVIIEKDNASQARIDSLIKEAELILSDLKTINPRNKQELLVSFEYNSFKLSDTDKNTITAVLDNIKQKEGLTISLIAFSGEGYSLESENLISNKRIHTIKEYFKIKGILPLNISIKNHSMVDDLTPIENDNIGVVKIIFNL